MGYAVKARFYDLIACGYYPERGAKRFGDLSYLMHQLSVWSMGKTLKLTGLPYEDGKPNAYLADIQEQSGIYLVTLWVETANTSGKVASIQASAAVGAAKGFLNGVQAGTIPGYACYFAVFPQQNFVAALRIGDSTLGTKQLRGYCEAFLATSAQSVVRSASDPTKIVAYEEKPGVKHDDVHAKVGLRLIRNEDTRKMIVDRAVDVRKIVRIRTLKSSSVRDHRFWQKLTSPLKLPGSTAMPITTRVRYEVNYTGGAKEIGDIIDAHINKIIPRVNDIGFKFVNDQSPIFLSSLIAKFETELQLVPNDGLFRASDVLAKLVLKKVAILREAGK